MKFHYKALDANNKVVESDIESQGSDEVLGFLASQGLKPISIKVYKTSEIMAAKGFFGQNINISDKIFLTKYLALMLRAGTDLFRAIDVLIKDFDKPALKAFLNEIKTSLEKGQSFYSTFSKYPNYFSSVFVNLVKAGESSGNLESVFFNLSASLSKEQELRNKIRSALVYPAILMGVSFIILTLLVTFALPKIANVFEGTGYQPPLFCP